MQHTTDNQLLAPLPHPTAKEFERFLRNQGYSIGAAKLITAMGHRDARERAAEVPTVLQRAAIFLRRVVQ